MIEFRKERKEKKKLTLKWKLTCMVPKKEKTQMQIQKMGKIIKNIKLE